MSRRIIVTASKDAKERKIQAAKCAENVRNDAKDESSETEIESSTELPDSVTGDPEMDEIMTKERQVPIEEDDWNVKFKDVGGGFDSDNSIISLGDLKKYWNACNVGDPVLYEYDNFQKWFRDTRSNFLKEYHES